MGWQIPSARVWSKGSLIFLDGRYLGLAKGIHWIRTISRWMDTLGNSAGLYWGGGEREGIHDGSVFLSLVSVSVALDLI